MFILITGLSGSGKSCASAALEDIGYYCIDNLPPPLMTKFAQLVSELETVKNAAMVTDVRSSIRYRSDNGGNMFDTLYRAVEDMKSLGFDTKILFLDAPVDTILRRYKETRRNHPLETPTTTIEEAISKESLLLEPVRAIADYVIDTRDMSTAVLRKSVLELFMENVADSMMVTCMSFGFKYGVPADADIMFDVRFLQNPFYIPEFKQLTGLDSRVRDFVMGDPRAVTLLEKLRGLLDFLLPAYVDEGKSHLTVAFGCTGGKHRSVTYAEIIHEHVAQRGFVTRVVHRDLLN
ncbi:nucleotide-binding protein [Clostridia bacterium]|nr:nucleotide-binding protein [Clostridia bacterium]